MGVSDRVSMLIPLLLIFPMLFSAGFGAVFFLNTTTPNDVLWNDVDPYAIYLDELNPYSYGSCANLTICFIDDTNVDYFSSSDHDFIIDNFFSGNPDLANVFPENSIKQTHISQTERYTYSFYNDTTTGDISAIVQRGTVWETYEDIELINFTTISDTSLEWFNQSSTDPFLIMDNSYFRFYSRDFDLSSNETDTYSADVGYMKNDDVIFLLLNIYENGISLINTTMEITHYQTYEFGFSFASEESGYDACVAESGLSDYYSPSDSINDGCAISGVGSVDIQTNLYNHESPLDHKFHGISIRDKPIESVEFKFYLFPKIQYKVDGTYKSVDLPSCEDIAVGNEQTDFYYNSSDFQWWRRCEGIVPTPEAYTCDLECLEYGDTYAWNSKELASALIPSSAVSYTTHVSIFDRGDGYGYIFPSGTNPDDIGDIRIFSYVQFETGNASEVFSIKGWGQLGTIADSFTHVQPYSYSDRTCYYGIQNVTNYHIWGYYGGVRDESIAQSYTDVKNPVYDYIDWVDVNAYYTAQFDITRTDPTCENDLWTPVNSTATKRLYVRAEWQNITEVDSYCAVYQPICYPEVPDGYTYDNDSIVCVGASCYVEAGSECNNDGVCDIPFETNALCPNDCLTPTGSEIVDSSAEAVGGLINAGVSFIAQIFDVSDTLAKGVIWMVLTIVAGGVIFGISGVMIGAVATYLLMMLVGTMIGWMPIWIGIVFITLTGFVLAKTISDFVKGG